MTSDDQQSTSLSQRLGRLWGKFKDNQAKGAQEALLQEVFQDLYKDRFKIYKMNFFRGIFFGFGSVLGGTVLIIIAIWILSLFVDFPLIGQYLQDIQNSLQQTR